MRRTKIVRTLGPAVNTTDRFIQLINAGMSVARLNMSHGDYDKHEDRLNAVREAAWIAGRTMDILADLQGPEIRLDRFINGRKHYLEQGDHFTITTGDILGTKGCCSATFKSLPRGVKPGDQVLIDDGKVGLWALEASSIEVLCEVVVADPVSNNKGINLPGVAASVPTMSKKDGRDLHWALSKDIDMIALSFVRSGDNVKRVHEVMEEEGHRIPVITKLEKPQTITNLQEIVDAFSAFIVARGNLRVELPPGDVPLVQKRIVHAVRKWAKPVIVATQVLESMISSPQSTRAEASDVVDIILDGADGVMLSDETSIGNYPVETVQTMARAVETTEHDGHAEIHAIGWDPHTAGSVFAHTAVEATRRVGTRYLVAFTKSGDTARRLSRLRPSIPLLVLTPEVTTRQAMTLTWGVEAHITPDFTVQGQVVEAVDTFLRGRGIIEVGGRITTLPGSPMGVPGKAGNLRVHKVKAEGEAGT